MVIELANPLLAPITFPCQRRDRIKIHLAGKKERTREPPGQNQSCTSFLSVFDSLPAPFLTFHLPPASTLSFYFLPFLFIFPFLLLFLFLLFFFFASCLLPHPFHSFFCRFSSFFLFFFFFLYFLHQHFLSGTTVYCTDMGTLS